MADTERRYSRDHEWVRIEGNEAFIGITEFAQSQLGDIVYVELPEVSSNIEKDEVVCAVESVKTAADIISPVSGKIIAVNDELEDQPELINEDPYAAWIMQVELSDPSEFNELMNEADYSTYCENEE
ncbi:MAG TPA: glycine cleavage system protein GcvH [Clostridia bacterium]|nr:glycine cleavage system protein GcvH [Clostridia bacterium]HPQ46481.1 glycine cleavage system protein GcvH [Clostridia bacterium]HRX41497.1 glycine cleavage system protein GcvH [Clostridia bacterium]